jgi:transcriptional regulator with XRE-family HTH domain
MPPLDSTHNKSRKPLRSRVNSILHALRLQRGLTIQELADLAHADPSQVSYWERGVREPSRESRSAYAKALGIPVGDLGRYVYEAGGSAASVTP